MKKFGVAILFLFSAMNIESKEYIVFLVHGNVTVNVNGVVKPVTEKMIIKDTWEICVSDKSTLMLKDEKKRRIPNLNGYKCGTLKKLIKTKDVSFIKCISDIWTFIIGRTASDYGISIDGNKKVYMRGSTPRGDNAPDSLAFHDKMIKDLIEKAIEKE